MDIIAPTHCLDACAVIAYLREEAGAEVLKEIIERSNTFERKGHFRFLWLR